LEKCQSLDNNSMKSSTYGLPVRRWIRGREGILVKERSWGGSINFGNERKKKIGLALIRPIATMQESELGGAAQLCWGGEELRGSFRAYSLGEIRWPENVRCVRGEDLAP